MRRWLLLLLVTNIILYSNYARFSSMGGLWYLFQDDFNQLNLYDFSHISSALFRDDSLSYFYGNFSGFYESEDTIKYYSIGKGFPKLVEEILTHELINIFSETPFFKTYPFQIIYSYRKTEFFSGFEESPPFATELIAEYSYLSKKDEITLYKENLHAPSVEVVYSRPYSENIFFGGKINSFYARYKGMIEDTVDAYLFPIGGAVSGCYIGEVIQTGIDVNYNYAMFEFENKDTQWKEKFSGHLIFPTFSLILTLHRLKWLNSVCYAWSELKNEENREEKIGTNNYSLNTLFFFNFSPFKLFSGFTWSSKTPKYEGIDTLFKTEYNFYTLLLGTGIEFQKYKIGVELYYDILRRTDKINDSTSNGFHMELRFGNELQIFQNTFLRLGTRYEYLEPDKGTKDDEMKIFSFSSGIGLTPLTKLRIDLGIIYTTRRMEKLSGKNFEGIINIKYVLGILE